jgi:hypothetical protein
MRSTSAAKPGSRTYAHIAGDVGENSREKTVAGSAWVHARAFESFHMDTAPKI